MAATHCPSNHARPTNGALVAAVLIGAAAAFAVVGCNDAATMAGDIESGGAQQAAAAVPAPTDRESPAVGSDQPAGLHETSVQLANIDPAMLRPDRQVEFPELAPLSSAEMVALLREAPAGLATIDPAMLQPERQIEFPELAPLSPAEVTAMLP